ncbi:sterol desaturase family protein [Paraburkholderia sp. LEh10]|uniref:sterol desaturase family protein n=1 Tax=Paraburkholderia sp. LEh10 TaxID=2821353 RepID=UPI001FD86D45|nr:sterol desaturase family protein [Paraburkholderia sp. LEh10]
MGEFSYHTNVETRRWVRLVFQRPKMHRIHHRHSRHRNNYGDITWGDMLFGTYENCNRKVAVCLTERCLAIKLLVRFEKRVYGS